MKSSNRLCLRCQTPAGSSRGLVAWCQTPISGSSSKSDCRCRRWYRLPNIHSVVRSTSLAFTGFSARQKHKVGTCEDSPFKAFTSLESISSAGVETVGDYAFYGCESLTSVSLPTA
ncbi:MAG: leucine-rich repeat domain-containing protein [Treponema sp.]|nr:leucine-rich repeat domain-containing protein [Treponema sp.]